jgi:GntR family transcriptional repressor for pyruvate dehydrogenase complex
MGKNAGADTKLQFEQKLAQIVSFKPTLSAVDFVINAIKELLIGGYLKPGERIPSESELAAMFSVSRGSIREAMKILSALGVVCIQRGNGTYIAESGANVTMDSLLFGFILTQPTLREMYDLRFVIETGVLESAINNATEEDIVKLQECLDKMKAAANLQRTSPKEFTRMDIEFHTILGAISGNRLMQCIYNYIMNYLSQSVYQSHQKQGNVAANAIESHTLIIKVLKTRDKGRISEAVHFALNTWLDLINKNEREANSSKNSKKNNFLKKKTSKNFSF